MLRTLAFAFAFACTSALGTTTIDELPLDVASHDPMAIYEMSAVGNALASVGRQLAEVIASTPAAKPKKPSGASGPGQMGISALRYKLSQAYCPTADAKDKSLLACKNFEISKKVRATTDVEEKKRLGDERKALYTAASKTSAADKKAAAEAHKNFYSRAFKQLCSRSPTSDVCTNDLMKNMYGGDAAVGAKKLKRAKKA